LKNRASLPLYRELAKELGRDRGIGTKIWHNAGLIGKSKNRYELNHDYFENIDSPDKAYFLGLLASDGNIFDRGIEGRAPIIKLSLQSDDEYILKLFAKFLSSDKPLHHGGSKSKNGITQYSTIEVVSKKMASDLSKHGVGQRKTYDYKMQNLSDEIMSHFIY
jgi:hypothetical protein